MNRIMTLFCVLMCASLNAKANWNFAAAVQQVYRPEANTEDYFETRVFKGYSIATAYKSWWFEVESNSEEVVTGNMTLSTTRELQQTSIWLKKEIPFPSSSLFLFALGGEVGSYREKLTTKLGVAETEATSADQWVAGLSFGLRLNVPWVWISLESRAELMQNWSPSPLISVNGKLGIWF